MKPYANEPLPGSRSLEHSPVEDARYEMSAPWASGVRPRFGQAAGLRVPLRPRPLLAQKGVRAGVVPRLGGDLARHGALLLQEKRREGKEVGRGSALDGATSGGILDELVSLCTPLYYHFFFSLTRRLMKPRIRSGLGVVGGTTGGRGDGTRKAVSRA